ncbi:MAG TPA: 3-hydroxyacyl-CoA dehydrogenase [Microvirga sp.]|jgi:3-hydroxyacyl-CoA dehydrogenase|nr:3-hydroxyacyl-CoA dehydrogenase [Microvirga sp.]
MQKVAIVGSGLIGRAWATVFASHGWQVALNDVAPGAAQAAIAHIGQALDELAGHGLVEDPKGALARVAAPATLAEAVEGASLVQENGPESVEAKRALFAELDRLAHADAILASSTSFIVASRFSEDLPGRRRCLVAHPVNPPHLVPIVELCPAPWTDPAVVERARAIYESAGQVPILVRKEAFGFVLNRLQAVLMAEAFRLVGEGIVSPDDLDKTIRDGLGLRWAFLGPFETIELNAPGGIPDYCKRYAPSLGALVEDAIGEDPFGERNAQAVLDQWEGSHDPERIRRLSAWRDARLAALKAHKRAAAAKPD